MTVGSKVEVAFQLTTGDAPYFRVGDSVKGKIGNATYRVAGPIWIDITDYVISSSVKRGRNRELDRFSAGQLNVQLNNESRIFDPLNTSSPYNGNIIPRRAIRISTGGVTQFTGVIEDWDFSYETSGASKATIKAADAFTLFAQQQLTAGTAITQTTGERVNAVLSMPTVAWPLTDRAIDTGSSTIGADVFDSSMTAIDYLIQVETSEQGQLFMGKSGWVTFINGTKTIDSSGTYETLRTNLVTNPSFEVNTTGWAGYNTTISRITTDFYRGTACLQSVATATGYVWFRFNVTASTTYTLSAWVKGTAGQVVIPAIIEYTSGLVYVGETNAANVTLTGSWQRISVTRALGSTAGVADFRVRNINAQTFFVDAVLAETSAIVGDYFDGSTQGQGVYSYTWTGTANASSSIYRKNISIPLFSDEGDGIPYSAASVNYGTDLLYNQVTSTSPAGTAVATNTDSQNTYGIAATSVSSLLSTLTATSNLAQYWVNKYGQPEYRFDSLVVNLDGLDGADLTTVLGIELGDIIVIQFTPNSIGDPIVRFGQIISVDHSISAASHEVTFGVGSLQYSFLVLDDTGFGILDQNALGF